MKVKLNDTEYSIIETRKGKSVLELPEGHTFYVGQSFNNVTVTHWEESWKENITVKGLGEVYNANSFEDSLNGVPDKWMQYVYLERKYTK